MNILLPLAVFTLRWANGSCGDSRGGYWINL